ncbi:MAG: LTA synthase family protein [Lachnospiraceae bacterium]|nr:LTA synthase family protein [Lachnospiraceae bacterium]
MLSESGNASRSDRQDPLPSRIQRIYSYLMLFLSPIVAFYCLEWMTHNPWEYMTIPVQLWNILFYELVYLLLFFLTRRVRCAVMGGSLLFLVIGLVNYFVIQFRSAPIVPWDIFSLRTAASVAGNYEYHITISCGIALVLCAALIIGGFFCRLKLPRGCAVKRLIAALVTFFLLGGYTTLLHQDAFIDALNLDNTLFTPNYMAKKNGFTTAFLMDLKYLTVEVPDDYSAEEAEATLAEYEEETETESTPNIIVIMDEAFSDPAVLGDFDTNEDYMPFVHSLQDDAENTISGYLNVSVKGGNTANSEYEFLTGNTMRFLPGGSVPYQQYIFSGKNSVVSWLESLGYTTAAMHPYNSTGWNRDKIYQYFGFDTILFNTDFTHATRIRKYISDESCFDKIIELYEEKEEDTPLFCFAVTMQNHSGYSDDYDNFDVNITAEGAASNARLNRYLSLMKLSDEALEELIDYFSEQDEETIIVFFGDHQPNDIVIESIWNLQGKSSDTLSEEDDAKRYLVPYVIWANYDIEESSGEDTSINFLATKVLEAAGLPLSSYQQYLSGLSEEISIISTQRLADSDGNELSEDDETVSGLLEEYNRLQYYQMYDNDLTDE